MVAITAPVLSPSKGAALNIHDSDYCASNGKSVAANQYWRSTKFFVYVATMRIGPTGIWFCDKNFGLEFGQFVL